MSRIAIVWGALVAATCMSWWLGTDHGTTAAASIVLAIAFVKVRFIGLWFMELRAAPLALRLVFEGWVAVVGTAVVALYVTG